jgi:hypothetical protein
MSKPIPEQYEGYYRMLLQEHGRDVWVEVKRNDALGTWKFTNSWIGSGWLSRSQDGQLSFTPAK